jgi:hypothetical protein
MSETKFKPGQLVLYGGQEYMFHCYVTPQMAFEDFGEYTGNMYAYIKSVSDDRQHDSRPSQNGRGYYCALKDGITPLVPNLHIEADSLHEITI